jgi:hypothetical protein
MSKILYESGARWGYWNGAAWWPSVAGYEALGGVIIDE